MTKEASAAAAPSAPAPSPMMLGAGALLSLVFLAIFFLDPQQAPNFDDTGVYWGAGSKALHHQTVYDVTGHYTFNYLPFASLFYAFAFAVFPIRAFGWAFYFVSAGAWLALVVTMGRVVLREALGAETFARSSRSWAAFAIVVFAIFYGVGLRDELKLGQTMIIPLWAASAFILLYDRWRARDVRGPRSAFADVALAGLLCFAIEIKIYFAVLVALMAFRREWRIVALVAVWHVVFSVVFLAAYHGPAFAIAENVSWFSAVRYASDYHMMNNHNMSVMGLVAKAGAPMIVARLAWLVAVGFFLAGLFRLRDASPIRGFCACLAAVVPLNPIAWPYWMLLGFPAMIFVLGSIARRAGAGERRLALTVAPLLVLYFVMSAAQNEGFAKHGGLLAACLVLVSLTFVFTGALRRSGAGDQQSGALV